MGGGDQNIGCFQRLNPSDEEHEDVVLFDSEPLSARLHRPGGERLQIDPRQRDGDAFGVGLVERHQVVGLGFGVGDEHVGGGDHLLLAQHPLIRLGIVPGRQREVLHFGHRVHAVHQRDLPSFRGHPADLAGQPVMRMHEVVVPLGTVCLCP